MANAQRTAEVTISLDEQFFDVLLDAVFTNLDAPSVPLTLTEFNRRDAETRRGREDIFAKSLEFEKPRQGKDFKFADSIEFKKISASPRLRGEPSVCDENIRLQREIDGVRTAVKFRQGKIYAPIAFRGNYNPPLIGCVGFSGFAETNIELAFDGQSQTLVGRAKVLNVNLSGTGGIGGSLLTRLVQSSIDDKINPLKILEMEKVSFTVPVQNSGKLKMKAVGMRHTLGEGVLNVHVKYQFLKG